MRETGCSRRAFLRGGIALGIVGALAGCGGQSGDTETPTTPSRPSPQTPSAARKPTLESLRQEYDTVVDMGSESSVRDGQPLDQALDEHAADDTLLYLPEGRYSLEDTWEFYEFERFGLYGDDATVVPPEGFATTMFDIGNGDGATGFRFVGIDFDFSAPSTGARPLNAAVDDDLIVSDVTVRGTQDVDKDMFRVDVTSADGTGVVSRVSLPDGGDPRWSITGFEVGDMNRGTARFVDCHIAGFPDNGLYADPPEGVVEVIGGRYENNNISNVRVNADPGSVIRGVHVRCDESPEGFENMRGIRLRGGDQITVEGCLVEMLDVSASDGGIAVSHEMGRATIRDTHVHVDADDVSGIRLKSFSGGGDAGRIELNDVLFTGKASGGAAIEAADRDGFVFQNLCVLQYGDDRDGLYADQASGTFRNSTVAVEGDPLHVESAQVDTSNLRLCRNPERRGGQGRCVRNCQQLSNQLHGTIPSSEIQW